jgi:hypothetical protein
VIDLPPPTYEQVIEEIVRCDIPRSNVRIKYQNYLRSDGITISDLGPLNDKKFGCLKAAVHPFYILTIANQAQQAAFYDCSRRDDRPAELADARAWLTAKGLMEKLPSFSTNQGLTDFAGALESACGLAKGSALKPLGESSLAVRPDFLIGKDFETASDSLECLMKMFAASNAQEHDISFGFIGNEADAEEDKK